MTMLVDTPEIRIERVVLGKWSTNAYLVSASTGDSVVVDAPADAATILQHAHGTRLKYVLLTHGHSDHTGALAELKSKGVLIAAHRADSARLPCPVDTLLEDGGIFKVGKLSFQVFHTPGHTPGSICFLAGGHLLCGDTIFPGGPGSTDSPADLSLILKSIKEKILSLADGTELHPGHGESTTVKAARSEFAIFESRKHPAGLCGDVTWLSS